MNVLIFFLLLFLWRTAFRVLKALVILGLGAWLLFDASKEHPKLVRAFWQDFGELSRVAAGEFGTQLSQWAQQAQAFDPSSSRGYSDFLKHDNH
jgi:hypothetical protein